MCASYTAMEYVGPAVAVGLGGIVLILSLSFLIIRIFGPKFKNPLMAFSLLVFPLASLVLLINSILPTFQYVGDLLISSEYVLCTTAGQIDSVRKADVDLYHYRNGRFCAGEEIVVDGISYYVISEGLLSKGMYVELQYAQYENNAILFWQEVAPERAEQIRQESLLTDKPTAVEKQEPEPSPEARRIGTWLYRIGLFGFLATVGLCTAFRQKLLTAVLRQDACFKGEIRFRKAALLQWLIPVLFICMIVLGLAVGNGGYDLLVILVIGVGGMAAIMGADAATGLTLDGTAFTIRRLWRTNTYQLSDIRAVFWRDNRGMIGRTMVLSLNNGKMYWFSMDSFSGVEYVYAYMSRYLESNREEAEDE